MTISIFFTNTFTVKRMVWVNNSYSELADVVSFDGHLQQTSSVLSESLGLRFTKAFTIWCPIDTVIMTDDRIASDGEEYTVRFVKELLVGRQKHLQIVAEKTPKDYE